MIIAILGGTGKEGGGLAMRWAQAGHTILIGSRDAERAGQRAAELSRQVNGAIEGLSNLEAARRGELVVITVPFAGHRTLLEEVRPALQGKIVVDTVVPVDLKAPHPYDPPAEGSAAERRPSRFWGQGQEWSRRFTTSPPMSFPLWVTSFRETVSFAATTRPPRRWSRH
ncbi:MAG: NAD(P)-binding domain-containing protein [Candidatus Rokubacteria bacterium]|nr:NAD(P)-binding domain-containing protein [Candidatus Rokubacteria bacterium]